MSELAVTEVKGGARVVTRYGLGTIIAKEVYYGKPRYGIKHDQENEWTRLSPGLTPFFWPNEFSHYGKELSPNEVEFTVLSHNDSLNRCRFIMRWYDPEFHLGPMTRGQVFFAKIGEYIKKAEERGEKVIHAKPDYS